MIAIFIFIISLFLSQQIISNSLSNQQNKNDFSELNHIRYGFFSVDTWKHQIILIITDEIDKLYLTNQNEHELKKHVEIQLSTLIDKISNKIKLSNKGTAGGWIKQSFINTFVNLDDIKKGIPSYADAMIHEMTKSKTEHQVKDILKKRIEEYFDKTFDTQDLTHMKHILQRVGSSDLESAKIKLDLTIKDNQALVHKQTLILIILSFILFAFPGFSKKSLSPSFYILLVLTLLVLLVSGVTTPMIDMEAKISQLSFVLLDHPVHFENQVLYFQSKSVLDVFWVMITHKDFQMKAVGILMISFSILFPLFKMLSSLMYYYNFRQARENKIIQFFVLKSGKWSMADVLVVSIFMAYVGFNGIITSQLGQLSDASQELVILTTNGTSLQPGYYLFLTYTLLALLLSGFLTRNKTV